MGDDIHVYDWSPDSSPRQKLAKLPKTAHDWEEVHRRRAVTDDGTMTFFWRAHTIIMLIGFCACLIYVAVFEDPNAHDNAYNFRRGMIAVVIAFLAFGLTHTPDGPFIRPHPALWRMVLCLSIVYELFLLFLLFQTAEYSRQLMKEIDPVLGEPLPERSYANNCIIYDTEKPDDPFHNVWEKMDLFVPTHFFGWWVKTLMLRDYWLCHVLSILFEVMEYTLEHQLPNFAECWWDHWIMDFLLCNSLGIWLGMRTLHWLQWRPYHWRGIWNIPSYREKLQRLAFQFTPYSWTDFDWRPTISIKRWCAMCAVIAMFLLAELNTFYLKFVLWFPPDHPLCLSRLFFVVMMGTVAMRETFEYLDNPKCKQFGRQSWMMCVIIITEGLIILKYEPNTVLKPLPGMISMFWIVGLIGLVLFTVWKFYLKTHISLYTHSQKNSPKHIPIHQVDGSRGDNSETSHKNGCSNGNDTSPSKARRRSKKI